MKFKHFLIVFLLALIVTVVGVNLSAVEGTTSSIENFWCSIPDQYKTRLKVYTQEGKFAYMIEMVLGNETTLGKSKVDILKFMLGEVPEYKQNNYQWKRAFLLYIYKPPGAVGGKFEERKLTISVPDIPLRTSLETTKYARKIRGPLAEELRDSPENETSIKAVPLTGVFIISGNSRSALRKAKDKGYKVFLYYKGGGPRVELKLPGEI